ncbi:hypothetical protein EJ08DRAFT_700513 [Tothia fuscella]|uniref:Uncharacterized protein n=1 Tax=Tothia fuscella TaxID=1048955 RepID=A0A9P4NKH1_9PEZI|nr:hypothetical protein EJ08DRAFT_700513 [Tothia fuscella]
MDNHFSAELGVIQSGPTEMRDPSIGTSALNIADGSRTPLDQVKALVASLESPELVTPYKKTSSASSVGLDDGENSEIRDGTDSGYGSRHGSGENSPDIDVVKGKQAVPCQLWSTRKVFMLKRHPIDIPEATRDRFRDLVEMFDEPLSTCISAGCRPLSPIKITLQGLGVSKDLASLWIVVLCDANVSKRIRQFFKQRWVIEECKGGSADSTEPTFRVLVCERPPRLLGATMPIDLYTNKPHDEFRNRLPGVPACYGVAIYKQGDHSIPCGTLGGILGVKVREREVFPYGLTVGHILDGKEAQQESDLDPNFDTKNVEAEDHEEEKTMEEDLTVHELDAEDLYDRWTLETQEHTHGGFHESTPPHKEPRSRLGRVAASSIQLDWALTTFGNSAPMLPTSAASGQSVRENSLKNASTYFSSQVCVVSDISGILQGSVKSTSYLMLPSSRSLVEVYDFVLADDHTTGLKAGDCGSWAIDQITNRVYGHVVSSDVFGEVSVMPLSSIMRDTKIRTGVEAIGLPSAKDTEALLKNSFLNKEIKNRKMLPNKLKKYSGSDLELFDPAAPHEHNVLKITETVGSAVGGTRSPSFSRPPAPHAIPEDILDAFITEYQSGVQTALDENDVHTAEENRIKAIEYYEELWRRYYIPGDEVVMREQMALISKKQSKHEDVLLSQPIVSTPENDINRQLVSTPQAESLSGSDLNLFNPAAPEIDISRQTVSTPQVESSLQTEPMPPTSGIADSIPRSVSDGIVEITRTHYPAREQPPEEALGKKKMLRWKPKNLVLLAQSIRSKSAKTIERMFTLKRHRTLNQDSKSYPAKQTLTSGDIEPQAVQAYHRDCSLSSIESLAESPAASPTSGDIESQALPAYQRDCSLSLIKLHDESPSASPDSGYSSMRPSPTGSSAMRSPPTELSQTSKAATPVSFMH